MENLIRDLRFAFRQLRRRPGFATVAVATLALGIGASTTVFSAVDSILLRPLPYEDADRLAVVWERNIARERDRNVVASPNFVAWREASESFESMAAYGSRSLTVSADGESVRIGAASVTPSLFEVFGVRPALGRAFDESDAEREESVVVLSHGLWQRLFGGDPGVVGGTVRVEGGNYRILGVMPRSFELPEFPVMWWSLRSPDLWLPLRPQPEYQGRSLVVFGKLARDVSAGAAQAELAGIARGVAAEHEWNEGWSATVVPLHEQVVGETRTPLLLLFAAVGLLLLIACGNVANLMLARMSARSQEFALRSTLGADRGLLVRQLLTESSVVAGLGAAGGVLLALWGTRALPAFFPDGVPRADHLVLDARVLAVAVLLSVGSALLFGLVPALYAGRPDLRRMLATGGRGASRPSRRLRKVLIGGEVALALMLLAGAGLLGRSLLGLRGVDPGFEQRDRLSFRLALPDDAGMDEGEIVGFYDRLLGRVEAVPGVRSAAAAMTLPFGGVGIGTSFVVEGRPDPGRAGRPVADVRPVTPGYFRTLGTGLVAGRDFDERDRPPPEEVGFPGADGAGGEQEEDEATPVTYIVNESMAREFWPGEEATGKRVGVSLGGLLWGRVVGVVEDVRLKRLGEPPRATIYIPHAHLPVDALYVVAEAEREAGTLMPALRGAVAGMGLDLPPHDVATMEERVAGTLAAERFRTTILAIFAGLALLLAAVGLYGVVSQLVGQRRREIAIRMAMGARAGSAARLVMGQAAKLALAGIAAGILGALVLSRFLRTLLFEVEPYDPVTLAVAAGVLLGTTLLAAWMPARRAASVEPMALLREE